jgi:hypothetical protein
MAIKSTRYTSDHFMGTESNRYTPDHFMGTESTQYTSDHFMGVESIQYTSDHFMGTKPTQYTPVTDSYHQDSVKTTKQALLWHGLPATNTTYPHLAFS